MITVESIDEGIMESIEHQSELASLEMSQIKTKFTSNDLNEMNTVATSPIQTIHDLKETTIPTSNSKYTISDLQEMAPKRAKVKIYFKKLKLY